MAKENYENSYPEWCGKQAEHVVAKQNHTDAGITTICKKSEKILTEVELSREYDEDSADKLDLRLEKMEKKLAKIAPVNMAKTIENALSGCMEIIMDQLTDRVVKRFEIMAEEERKKEEIRRGKQVEGPPESVEMSDIEFEPRATLSVEENEKVGRASREEMEVEEKELDQSRHAPIIPPGGVRKEFPRLEVGLVKISKKKPVVPAVPEQKKKQEVKKL
jgi:23S rRNA G2069 N7-methylase RlmK/C1962 C5-methylase RlmI